MNYTTLGNTDIKVSTICFGCWAIVGGFNWGHQEKSDSLQALRAAYDSGITFFDTAEMYGDGYSEELIAEALGDVRDDVIIGSKVAPSHFAPADLRRSCEDSLTRLKTDRIDLYQLHWPSTDHPLEESLRVLEALKKEGKIRSYGVSNFGKTDLEEYANVDLTICSNQMAYSLIFRAVEYDVLPICARNSISILCYSSLMQGLLAGKFACVDDVPEDRARTRHFSSDRPLARHDEPGLETDTFNALDNVRSIADEIGVPMADVSIAWLLAQPGVTSAIVGGRTADQATRNARAADVELSDEVIGELSAATDTLKEKLGDNADMWQQKGTRIR